MKMASCSSVNTVEEQISIENKDVNSFRREIHDHMVVFSLCIPLPMFLKWKEHDPNLIVSLVNECISQHGVKLDESCVSLRQRLKKKTFKVWDSIKAKSKQGGRIYEQYMMGNVLFDIKKHEIVCAAALTQKVTCLEKEVQSLKEDASKKAESLEKLANEKQHLIQSSVVAASLPFNYGKIHDHVGLRQQQRQVSKMRNAAEQALFFVHQFGFVLEKLVLVTTEKNKTVDINYISPPSPDMESSESQLDEEITEDLHDSVKETLYLLEKFGISDECYHELAMLNPQLPRLYKVKNARTDITHEIELVPLPGRNGVYRPIKNCLALVLSRKLSTCKELLSSVQVKFSGDGARFTRSASYVLLSFSFPSLSTDVLAGSGNHMFAAIRCVEKYDTLCNVLLV